MSIYIRTFASRKPLLDLPYAHAFSLLFLTSSFLGRDFSNKLSPNLSQEPLELAFPSLSWKEPLSSLRNVPKGT
jgi:hypothetical protein